MEKDDSKLTTEQKEGVRKFLEEKGAIRSCEACGHNSWTIGDHVVSAMIHSGGGITIGGPTYPQVMIICSNCFNTRNHMIVPMSVLSAEKKNG